MAASAALFVSLLAFAAAAPVLPLSWTRSIAVGADVVSNPFQRYRDTIGTAMDPAGRGALRTNAVFHSDRSAAVSAEYRNAFISLFSKDSCQFDDENKCEVAVNGIGTVGEVQYTFNIPGKNVRGRSTQVMVACRCASRDCSQAVLMRPVNVLQNASKEGDPAEVVGRTCIYRQSKRTRYLDDCHREVLRTTTRPINAEPYYPDATQVNSIFNYKVPEVAWSATGQRGWTYSVTADELDAMPTVNLSDYGGLGNKTRISEGKGDSMRWVREVDDADGAACAELYKFADAAASWRATQQDIIATGRLTDTYLDGPPNLISTTELALVSSAAGLGTLAVWATYLKHKQRPSTNLKDLVKIAVIQVLVHALESFPIHVALVDEISARQWKSQFVHIDGTLAVFSNSTEAQPSAARDILINTAVAGTVEYRTTKLAVLVVVVLLFDAASLIGIVLTVAYKGSLIFASRHPKLGQEQAMPYADADSAFLASLAATRPALRQRSAQSSGATALTDGSARARAKQRGDAPRTPPSEELDLGDSDSAAPPSR